MEHEDTKNEVTIMRIYEAYLNLTNPNFEAPDVEMLESQVRKGCQNIYSVEGRVYKDFARWLYKNLKKYLRFKKHKFDIAFNILYYKDAIYEPEGEDYYKFVDWLRTELMLLAIK